MAKQSVKIQPPIGGLNRAAGFQDQAPFMTPDAMNVWPRPSDDGRTRIGTRPGMKQFHYIAKSSAINMMGQLSYVEDTLFRNFDELITSPNPEERWETGVAGMIEPTRDALERLWYHEYTPTNNTAGFVRTVLSQDTAETIYFNLMAVPHDGRHSATYKVHFFLHDTSPDPTDTAVTATLTLTTNSSGNDVVAWAITKMNGGALTSVSSGTNARTGHDIRWIRVVLVPGSTQLQIQIDQKTSLAASSYTAAPATRAGTRIGWSMTPTGVGDRAAVNRVHFYYKRPAGNEQPTEWNRTVLGTGGEIHDEQFGYTEEVDPNYSINADFPIMTAQRAGALYIADYGRVREIGASGLGAGICKTSGTTVKIDVTDNVIDYINIYDHVVSITASTFGTAQIPVGTYQIASVSAGTGPGTGSPPLVDQIILTRASTTPITGNIVAFEIVRSAKIYTSGAISRLVTPSGTDLFDTSFGTPPPNCKYIWEYRDRLGLASETFWAMSRQGDPTDWAYGVDSSDPSAAYASTLGEVGGFAEYIRAAIPFGDDFMLWGTSNKIYRMVGDLAYGGRIGVASRHCGIAGSEAYAILPGGDMIFMDYNGVYRMQPLADADPENLSLDRLPNEFRKLDPNQYHPILRYDQNHDIVHIWLTGRNAESKHYKWVFEPRTRSFWPEQWSAGLEPLAVCNAKGFFYSVKPVLIGCRDGSVRYYDPYARTDDDTAISSWLSFGPIRGSSEIDRDSVLDRISIRMDGEASTLGVFSAGSANETVRQLITGDPKYSRDLRVGLNHVHPLVRGNAYAVRVSDSDGSKWIFDEMQLENEIRGRGF